MPAAGRGCLACSAPPAPRRGPGGTPWSGSKDVTPPSRRWTGAGRGGAACIAGGVDGWGVGDAGREAGGKAADTGTQTRAVRLAGAARLDWLEQ